jgi:hypothetical protein
MTTLPVLKNVHRDFAPPGCVATTVLVPGNPVDYEMGEQVVLIRCENYAHSQECDPALGCRTVGLARIRGWWTGALGDLPAELLPIEPAPVALETDLTGTEIVDDPLAKADRTVELISAIELAHQRVLDPNATVTVVIYQRSI